ncbi:Hypothetical predicted protein, partial [Pelobates cultripes]
MSDTTTLALQSMASQSPDHYGPCSVTLASLEAIFERFWARLKDSLAATGGDSDQKSPLRTKLPQGCNIQSLLACLSLPPPTPPVHKNRGPPAGITRGIMAVT